MKFRNWLILSVFFLSLPSQAQIFDGGIFGGIAASQVDGDYLGGYHKLGLNGGVYINTPLSNAWSMQMELRYMQKGAASFVEGSSFYQLTLHYVEIPVLLQAFLTDEVSVEIGLSPGRLMHTAGQDAGGSIAPLSEYKDWDVNFLLGINYAFRERWRINFRYAYSVMPIREYNTGKYRGLIPDLLNLKDGEYNNVLSLSLYYQLNPAY